MSIRSYSAAGVIVSSLIACDGSSMGADACSDFFDPLCDPRAGLFDPEGGQIFVEYINLDSELQSAFGLPSGVSTMQRTIAFFMNKETPDINPLPAVDMCNNLDATKGWPLYVGNPHTDLDAGTLDVVGVNAAGLPVDISLPNLGAGTDAIGRAHDIFYQLVQPGADTYLQDNSPYDVVLGGSSTLRAKTFPGGVFLPSKFQLGTPALEDNGPLVAGTDYTVTWTSTISSNLPLDDLVYAMTWLADTNGEPTHVCVTKHSDPGFTIPGATLTEYQSIAAARGAATSKVMLLRQAVVHHLWRLPTGDPTNLRRIDMLGIMSWAQLMDLQ